MNVYNKNQAMIKNFLERSRELSQCSKCNNLLNDPVKAVCGHLFCRTCIFEKVHNHTNSAPLPSCCVFCQDVGSNSHIEEVSLKISKLSSCLLQFVKDFCAEGGVTVASAVELKQSSATQPLIPSEKHGHSQEANLAVESETCSGSILISNPSPSQPTSHSTLQPIQKVDQWLMTYSDESPSTIHKEEDCENNVSVKNSEMRSSQSLKVLSPYLTSSSKSKELSYDIISAPSPPSSREDKDHQIKRGRPRRGRGRPRKNALPISTGENLAKKRERSNSITPELKVSSFKTHISHPNISEEIAFPSKSTKTVTTKMPSSDRFDLHTGLIRTERNMMQDETRQDVAEIGVSSDNIVFEKQFDGFGQECTLGERSLNHHTDTENSTGNREDILLPESVTPSGLNLNQVPLTSMSSPEPEKSHLAPSISYHLTPVCRPKTLNAATLGTNNCYTSAQKLRNHEPFPVCTGKRRTVHFFYKGRITPRISIHSFRRQPVIFTRLGKLGPILDKTTAHFPFLDGPRVDSQKMAYSQNTQTGSPLVSLASVATQTEAIEIPRMTTEVQSQVSLTSQDQVNVHLPKTLHMGGPPISSGIQERNEGNDKNFCRSESDECSENMFAEAFKRNRSLSVSDSENEMTERKRRKPSSLDFVNADPPSLIPPPLEPSPSLAKEVRQRSPELNTGEVAACKTVVMESDPDSDEEDILSSTPPRPTPSNPTRCKRIVITCSGIPRPQIKLIEDWAQKVGAVVSQTYNCSVTHVIVNVDEENCAQRTLKFLYGVASGVWIVGIDWVHKCIRENRILDEEHFEALDMDGEDGPRRARQTSQREKLFEAFEFCCQGPFTDVTIEQLNQLLHLCGATTAPSPSELTKRRQYTMIVVQTDDDVNLEIERKAADWFNRHKVVSVSREWVLDCLAAYQLLPVLNQFIGKYSVSVLKMLGFDARLGVQ
ncbi:hypothetical protein GHT06_015237 [Daphnia sinensis]|uniref:Uncharacterized protein n=1 Tax=Daphnia sinensis TaxID=1820382 RepID=A0AAD5PSS0_9CRUS|nr:hypothetical protein GHT06_015237 [Daphnia sinensis]